MNDKHQTGIARSYWDRQAAFFDEEPDHGLGDQQARDRWRALLKTLIPESRGRILDVGCGTGSLSVLLAAAGHNVTGIDFSPMMLTRARAKAECAGLQIDFQTTDAAAPQLPPVSFDVVISRHVLWAMPDPIAALRNWTALLRSGGRLVLIEGFWSTGAGLRAQDVRSAMPTGLIEIASMDLARDPLLWGGPVTDERYAITAQRSSP